MLPRTGKMAKNQAEIDKRLMRRAIEESKAAAEGGAMPFGAILAIDNEEVLAAQNASACTGIRGGGADVTRHAEMELIRKTCAVLTPEERAKATLYTSTEPCVMCAGAIYWAGISNVVYGCRCDKLETISGPGGFDIAVETLYAQAKSGCRKMNVRGPCLEDYAFQVHRESGCWSNNSSLSKEVSEIELERSLLSTGIGSSAAAVSDESSVRIIDMAKPDAEVALEMWKAANEVGFFTVINHDIDIDTIDNMFCTTQEFFSQPVEKKERQSPFDRSQNSGYEYKTQVRPSTGTKDQKESLQITAREGCMDGRWPSVPSSFRSNAEEMTTKAHRLACRIMSILEGKACPHLESGTLSRAHSLWGSDGQCTLRLIHYPPISTKERLSLMQPGNVHWRAGAHTDWDCVTLLFQRPGQAGLECRANPRATSSSDWIPVPPVEGGIAINIGDMLSRWSDGSLYSNLHRVRMPTEDECGTSRYSMAFFAQADKSQMIESQGNEPITAGDYILSRIRSNYPK